MQTPTHALGQLLAPLNEYVAFGLNGFKCSWVLACAPRCYWVLLVCSWELQGSSWGAPGRDPPTLWSGVLEHFEAKGGGFLPPTPLPPWASAAAEGSKRDVFLVFYSVLGVWKVPKQPRGALRTVLA